jgi:hypothetical protein
MGIQVNAEKSLVWDKESNQIVPRTAVTVSVVGNHGTVYATEGPVYCQTGQEIFEATMMLKNRLIGSIVTQASSRAF